VCKISPTCVNRKHAIQGVPYVVFTINLTEIDISPTRDLFSFSLGINNDNVSSVVNRINGILVMFYVCCEAESELLHTIQIIFSLRALKAPEFLE
jgi:hypothetical protein